MSLELHRLQRVKIQTEGTFGTAPANWTSAYDVRVAGNATVRRILEMVEDESVTQYQDARPDAQPGLAACQLTLPCYLVSHGTPLTGSQAWADFWLSILLQHVMGGLEARTNMGSTFSAGWNTVTGDLASATNLRQGGAIGCSPGTSGLYQVRELATLATNTLTTKIAFSTAPTLAQVCHGAAVAYLADDPTSTLQALGMGKEADDQTELYGLQGGFTLDLARGRMRMITFNLRGVNWARVTGNTFAPTTTTSIFGGSSPGVLKDAELQIVAAAASTARSLTHVGELRIEPQVEYEPQESTAGVNGVVRWRRVGGRPTVRGSFLAPFGDTSWETARAAKTAFQLFLQGGATAGDIPCVSVPKLQIMDVEDQPQGRKRAQRVTWAADHDTVTTWTAGPTELERTALKIILA